MIPPRGKPHALGGFAQQRKGGGIGLEDLLDNSRRRRRVAGDERQSKTAIPLALNFASRRDAFGDLRRTFGRRRQKEIGRSHRRYVDHQIEAVDQRP